MPMHAAGYDNSTQYGENRSGGGNLSHNLKVIGSNPIPATKLNGSLPIRLTHTPTTCRVRPVAGIKLSIGRCFYFASDAEQRAEGVERVEAPIEAKRKFVEVSL